jgi:hypothetical protein
VTARKCVSIVETPSERQSRDVHDGRASGLSSTLRTPVVRRHWPRGPLGGAGEILSP